MNLTETIKLQIGLDLHREETLAKLKEDPDFIQAAFDIFHWQHGGTNFTSMLYSLFQKADSSNKSKLGQVYPYNKLAIDVWNSFETQEEFFNYFEVGARK